MKFRTTLVLLVVVAALLAALRYLDRDTASDANPAAEKLLGDFEAQLVTRLEIDLVTREAMVLEVRNGEWWIVEPLVDRAKQEQVSGLIEILLGNPRIRIEAEPDLALQRELELEPPRARVTLIGDGGSKRLSLRVGARDPAGTAVYLRAEGDPALYQTGANLSNALELSRQGWRADRFVAGDGALVRRVELTRPGEPRIVAERKSGIEWTLLEPRVYAGDDGLLGRLVNGLLLLDVQNFTVANPDEATRVEMNLGDKATVATLDFGTRKVELRFGRRQADDKAAPRFATDSERRHGFVVRGPGLALLDVAADDLRDKRITRFLASEVTRIRLERGGSVRFEMQYRAPERKFYFTEPFVFACDDSRGSALRSWLSSVSSLEARAEGGFLELPEPAAGIDPAEGLGFLDPSYVIEIDTTDSATATRSLRVEVGLGDGGVRMVRRADQADSVVWQVPADRIAAVGDVDPRIFMERLIVDRDLENFERVIITRGERTLELRRQGEGSQRGWKDPKDPRAKTAGIEAYLFKLKGLEADRFLGRDIEASDGLKAESAATIEIHFGGARAADAPLRLTIGAADASGKLVHVTTDRLPDRTVCQCEIWVRDELDALFK